MSLFEALGLNPELVKAVTEMGFTTPTPIQEKVIPYLVQTPGDLVGLAQTGTGKTAAFGLPLLNQVDTHARVPQAIVICPTRELCLQITKDLEAFSKHMKGLRVLAVYGGSSIQNQISALRQGVQVIVGTPGRLNDLIDRNVLRLSEVGIAVLDEADEMLNMGFRDAIETILATTPEDKVTWLFSATMPKEVAKIAERFMVNPFRISAGGENKTASNIEHVYYEVQMRDRYAALRRIIDVNPNFYGIIFCRTRSETQEVADRLIRDGYAADSLHGDLSQAQRDYVMKRYRSRTLQMLVATDVAARGIDVDDITHVIHYSIPDELEVYTHRSGRTARAGKSGISALLIGAREKRKIRDLERIVGQPIKFMLVPGAKDVVAQQAMGSVQKILDQPEDVTFLGPILPQILEKFENMEKEELIVRFLNLMLSERLNEYKNGSDLNSGSGDRDRSNNRDQNFIRYFVNMGSLDGFEKADMLRYCCEMLKVDRGAIGRIDVQNAFSFVEVATLTTEQVLAAMNGRKYRGRSVEVSIAEQQEPKRSGFGGGKSKSRDEGSGFKKDPYKKKDGFRKEGGSGFKKEGGFKKDGFKKDYDRKDSGKKESFGKKKTGAGSRSGFSVVSEGSGKKREAGRYQEFSKKKR